MKTLILSTSVLTLLMVSCSTEPETEILENINYIETEIPELDDFEYDTLKGIYSGDFGGSNIRIILSYLSSKNATGYNIHRGLQRNLTGAVNRSGDSIIVSLAEPGDHEYDGVFELVFNGIDEHPTGTWRSNSGEISAKKFQLDKLMLSKEQYVEYDEELSEENFHLFFMDAYDSLGDYSFKKDGLVIFDYIPGRSIHDIDWDNAGNARVEQMKSLKGNWVIKNNAVVISWADNKIFPEKKMVYTIQKGEYEPELARGDNSIHPRLYP